MKKISIKEYAENYTPIGPWIVVEKHKIPEKVGSIYMPDKARESDVKMAVMGTVLAISPFTDFENPSEAYLMSKIKVGDWVGFSATVPVYSPIPPDICFENDLNQHGLDVATLHAGDILGVYTPSVEQKNEFMSRFKK